MSWWVSLLIGLATGLALMWAALVVLLARTGRRRGGFAEAARLLPDLIRLVSRLARDGSLPWGVRVRLWLLLGYLVSPIDLIPDFVPVLGYADDAIIVAIALRSVVRRAGAGPLERHWPGTASGMAAVRQLAGLSDADAATGGA